MPEGIPQQIARATEYHPTLKRLLLNASSFVGAQVSVLFAFEPRLHEMVACSPAYGLADWEVRKLRLGLEGSLFGEAWRTQRTVFHTGDDPTIPQERMLVPRLRHGVAVPAFSRPEGLRGEEECLGILVVFNRRDGEFTNQDAVLLYSLAKQLGALVSSVCKAARVGAG